MNDERLQSLAMEVSNPFGFLVSFEYVNTLREIFMAAPMTREDYNAGAAECNRLGRQRIVAMHQNAAWRVMTTPQP
jgi:hypothetical protein